MFCCNPAARLSLNLSCFFINCARGGWYVHDLREKESISENLEHLFSKSSPPTFIYSSSHGANKSVSGVLVLQRVVPNCDNYHLCQNADHWALSSSWGSNLTIEWTGGCLTSFTFPDGTHWLEHCLKQCWLSICIHLKEKYHIINPLTSNFGMKTLSEPCSEDHKDLTGGCSDVGGFLTM